MKFSILALILLILLNGSIFGLNRVPASIEDNVIAHFSPQEGKLVFEKIYKQIKNAKEYVYITIYSWSSNGLDKALTEAMKKNPNLEISIVLNDDLYPNGKSEKAVLKREKMKARITPLEELGIKFKKAMQNMHEKFVVVDDQFLVNTSANFSSGPLKSYSEDFVLFNNSDNNNIIQKLIQDFKYEFAVIWNSSSDIITENEVGEANFIKMELAEKSTKYIPTQNNHLTLFTSSMNYFLKKNNKTSKDFKIGRHLKLVPRYRDGFMVPPSVKRKPKESIADYKLRIKDRENLKVKNRPWVVRNAILDLIKNANKSILLSLNHFNIKEVYLALIEAIKERNIEVKLAVDNQEFKRYIKDWGPRQSIEMTPRFVRDWKKLPGNKNKIPPVRVKYYSHAPHPSFWRLNHHKFILVDYDANNFSQTKLLAGSYNVSTNAELNQFDNLILYKGKSFSHIFKRFKNQHDHLWDYERKKGKPSKKILDYFFKRSSIDGQSLSIHNNESVSLTWNEAIDLQKKIEKIAPKFIDQLKQNTKGCKFYNPKKDKFWVSINKKNGKYEGSKYCVVE